jgi:hypothetical protein
MTSVAVAAICVILGMLAVFQVLLIAGLPLGRFAWGGQHVVLPPRLRVGSGVSIVLYAVFAWVALERTEATDVLPGDGFVIIATWVLAGYFLLGTVMNAISRSKPERLTMTPVSLVLAVLFFALATA